MGYGDAGKYNDGSGADDNSNILWVMGESE